MRSSGVLMHISSLPSPGGIGSLGSEAYAFADFLQAAGFGIWQVLPVGPTGYGESPYQASSLTMTKRSSFRRIPKKLILRQSGRTRKCFFAAVFTNPLRK